MPSYKRQLMGGISWFCKFYFTDWKGEKVQKKKGGFQTKREADKWERDFLEKQASAPTMTFSALVERYLEDMAGRLKPTSINTKTKIIRRHLLPAFGSMAINSITPASVREWQSSIIRQGLAPTQQKNIHGQLSALFNYAVKFCSLPSNPARLAGGIGSARPRKVSFWTYEQFISFLLTRHKPIYIALYMLLFWTGCRIGEALALTANDISDGRIRITKTYARIHGREILQPPKTAKSSREITMPPFLSAILDEWAELAGVQGEERLFEGIGLTAICHEMKRHAERAGVPPIRLHDLRHSHASLLISLGVSAFEIKERLGHEDIKTTMNTYSHLWPSKEEAIAGILQESKF